MSYPNRAFFRLVAVSATLLAVVGCAKKPPNYTPEVADAEAAIRRCMDAWKEGKPPGELPGKPVVHITDVSRKPDQSLQSYEILGEARGTTGRTIVVSLQMANPDEVLKLRYIVVGIDPLWVFRQEDFDLLMHWDHYMPEKTDASKAEGDTADAAKDGEKAIQSTEGSSPANEEPQASTPDEKTNERNDVSP